MKIHSRKNHRTKTKFAHTFELGQICLVCLIQSVVYTGECSKDVCRNANTPYADHSRKCAFRRSRRHYFLLCFPPESPSVSTDSKLNNTLLLKTWQLFVDFVIWHVFQKNLTAITQISTTFCFAQLSKGLSISF